MVRHDLLYLWIMKQMLREYLQVLDADSRSHQCVQQVCGKRIIIIQFIYEYYIDLDRSVPPGTFLFIFGLLPCLVASLS